MKLTTEQIEEFHTRGVLIVKNALTDEDLHPVINEICEFLDYRALELKAERKIEDLCEDEPFGTRYGRLFAQSKEIASGLDIMNYRGKAVFEFLHNKNLLDVIESLVGTEIICNPIQHLSTHDRRDPHCPQSSGTMRTCATSRLAHRSLAPRRWGHYAGGRRLRHHHLLAE